MKYCERAIEEILQHIDSSGTYAGILSVAFNNVIPTLLQDKPSQLCPHLQVDRRLPVMRHHVKPGRHAEHRPPYQESPAEDVLPAVAEEPSKVNEGALLHYKSIFTSSITIWHAAVTAKDERRLQRIIRSTETVIACNLLPPGTCTSPGPCDEQERLCVEHKLWKTLPSGRTLESTSHHKNNNFSTAAGLFTPHSDYLIL
ncbi:hypothetical protein L3Q82_006374 [Scortum barcoo]|uniref:Uncharacterized protein n=1 Tax=Scortum barcoo TaxID=214431 RepID=A0ACB8WZI7_9TELE|nr:hypothetical protein L3Q82_006374 [Scortum barcoo]